MPATPAMSAMPAVRTQSKLGHTTIADASGTGAEAIHNPQHEGDSRATQPSKPNLIDELAYLPHHILESNRLITDIRNQVAAALEARVWANLATLSNTDQKGTLPGGTDAYAPAVLRLTDGQAIELRNVLVGTSAAATLRIVAARAPDLAVGGNLRILATVRTVANALSQSVPTRLWVQPGENLFVVAVGLATVKFDFSAEYRLMRGE